MPVEAHAAPTASHASARALRPPPLPPFSAGTRRPRAPTAARACRFLAGNRASRSISAAPGAICAWARSRTSATTASASRAATSVIGAFLSRREIPTGLLPPARDGCDARRSAMPHGRYPLSARTSDLRHTRTLSGRLCGQTSMAKPRPPKGISRARTARRPGRGSPGRRTDRCARRRPSPRDLRRSSSVDPRSPLPSSAGRSCSDSSGS